MLVFGCHMKANDSEIPLLHETRGSVCDGALSIEVEAGLDISYKILRFESFHNLKPVCTM